MIAIFSLTFFAVILIVLEVHRTLMRRDRARSLETARLEAIEEARAAKARKDQRGYHDACERAKALTNLSLKAFQ